MVVAVFEIFTEVTGSAFSAGERALDNGHGDVGNVSHFKKILGHAITPIKVVDVFADGSQYLSGGNQPFLIS